MRSRVSSAALALLVSGCITFNGKEIRRPEVEKPPEPYAVVELEVTKFDKLMNGKAEGFGANLNEGFLGRATVSQIARMWKGEKLIRDFGFPGDLEAGAPTHRLIISGSVDEVGSLAFAVLTGLTLYIIPSTATSTTDLEVTFIRLSDGREFTAHARNSHTLWQQIIFLPTSLLGSLAWGAYGAQKDRALYLYDEFEQAGAFAR